MLISKFIVFTGLIFAHTTWEGRNVEESSLKMNTGTEKTEVMFYQSIGER